MEPKFLGIAKYGKFVVDNCQAAQRTAYLRGLEGKQLEEIIQKPIKSKTLQQLRYFHGVICVLASETSGYTKTEVKGLLKGEFLTQYIESPTGKKVPWVPSLADLKKDEMSNFIDDCVILCARHWSCIIPPPEMVNYGH